MYGAREPGAVCLVLTSVSRFSVSALMSLGLRNHPQWRKLIANRWLPSASMTALTTGITTAEWSDELASSVHAIPTPSPSAMSAAGNSVLSIASWSGPRVRGGSNASGGGRGGGELAFGR